MQNIKITVSDKSHVLSWCQAIRSNLLADFVKNVMARILFRF